jgi:hypothetical protein
MMKKLPEFLAVPGLDEEPMGIFYTDEKPPEGFSPKPNDLPTREKEMRNEIDWQQVFGEFSCVKFFKTDELSFTVPFPMFGDMVNRYGESFLTTKTWAVVQKKIARSTKAWGENLLPGQDGARKDLSRKHERTKTRKKREKFRFSVMKIYFHTMQRIHTEDQCLCYP